MPMSGAEAIAQVRAKSDTVMLAFSCGKDAIGAWLECRKHFARVVPYYMYLVPGLEFVDRSLAYYEEWFGQRILRIPHPSLYRWLAYGVFQPPARAAMLRHIRMPRFTYGEAQQAIREDLRLGDEVYVASGVRAADSPTRRVALHRHGVVRTESRSFFPVWDWDMDRLLGEIQSAGVDLPVDYQWFGRSFDGIDYRFLEPLKRHAPRDYAQVLHWFPLAGAEIARREYAAGF